MATIGNLIVELELANSNFNNALKKSQREAEEFNKTIRPTTKLLGDVGKSMVGVGAGITAIGLPFGALAKQAIDAADDLLALSQRTTLSVESLSALSVEAAKSGTDLNAIEVAMKKLNVTLENAQSGNKAAAESLSKLGLSAEQVLAMKPDARFFALTQAIAGISDPALQAGAAVEVFGKSGTDLLPMLGALAKGQGAVMQSARELGVVVSTETAKAADDFNDSLTNLSASFKGVFNAVVSSGLLASLTELINRIATGTAEFTKAHPHIVAAGAAIAGLALVVGPVIAGFGLLLSGISAAIPVIVSIGGVLAGTAGLTGALGAVVAVLTGPVGIAVAIGAAIVALGVFLSKNEEVVGAVKAVWTAWGPTFRAVFDAAKAGFITVWDSIKTHLAAALKVLTGGIQAFSGALTGDWTLFTRGLKNIWQGLWDSVKAIVLGPINAVKGAVTGFTEGVTGAFRSMFNKVVGQSFVPDMMTGIQTQFGRLGDLMTNPARAAAHSVIGAFENMFSGIIDKFTRNIPVVGGLVGSLANQLAGGLLSKGLGSVLGGTKVGGLLGIGGAAGGLGGAGGGTAAGTAAGGGGLGSMTALLTNPWTAIAAGGIVGITALLKSQAHHEANTFVKKFQNPFGAELDRIMASTASATEKLQEVEDRWRDFSQVAQQFAQGGKDEATVVRQAFETLNPLIARLRTDLGAAIRPVEPAAASPGLATAPAFQPVINLTINSTAPVSARMIREEVMPAIDEAIELGIGSYREKWTAIFNQSKGVISMAVPA